MFACLWLLYLVGQPRSVSLPALQSHMPRRGSLYDALWMQMMLLRGCVELRPRIRVPCPHDVISLQVVASVDFSVSVQASSIVGTASAI